MPSTAWKETIADGEEARFERYAQQLAALQKKHAGAGAPLRALHAKGLAGAEAEVLIAEDVPDYARHGLFARPGTYRAFVRFSNGASKPGSDADPDVRGMAVKVLGVTGPKVLGDADEQDLLLIQAPATPFRSADEFVPFVLATAGPKALLPLRFAREDGVRRAAQILKRLASSAGKPVTSLAGTPFFSALPILVGPYAARYALAPSQSPDGAHAEARAHDRLGADLAARLRRGPIAWDLRLQFFEDDVRTPIEDASVDWDAPYVTVGRVTIPAQDVAAPAGRELAARVEALSFDPWHALVEHAPLGNMMRARKVAYFASVRGRSTAR